MARWEPNARGRLARAAMELYAEQGFDQTTVAEIAERAGLTERTFFRHFADKREVLFEGAEALQALFVTGVAEAPPGATPIEAVARALDGAAAMMGQRAPFARERQRVIMANPELQERELIKLARLGAAVAQALRERGVAEPFASLAAQAALAAFHVGFQRWVEDPERRDLGALIRDSLAELHAVTASPATTQA